MTQIITKVTIVQREKAFTLVPVEKRILSKTASMYYLENMKQSEIAARLGVNRTTVSKYIKRAVDQGIVTISIANYAYEDLEAELEKKFGLKEAYIVASDTNMAKVKQSMGRAGLNFLRRILANGQVVGMAWGTSVGALAEEAGRQHFAPMELDFVPLDGGPEYIDSDYHVNTLCYKTAKAFGARCHYIYAPAITKTPEIKQAILQDVNYEKIAGFWDKLNVALVGIGAPVNSSNLVWSGVFGHEGIQTLAESGVAGEICSVFYDINGRVVKTGFTDRIIAIELERLQKLEYSIGMAASRAKVPAILGALQGHFINVLITDEQTAKLLLQS
jgi:DNA-binding transcriptional regulator LsrR (DeoR family)